DSLLSMLGIDSLPRNVYYGDGTPLEDEVVEEIGLLYERTAVRFPWQEGDLIMLDNMLVAHARDPFVGPRKIVVAMGDMIAQSAVHSMTS
ncbi:MAG: TauD/TfdA family dioxygenase, partial [Nitrospira sp.]|nr:TauD/TfdA family dioxygenase [Nitrospira sp.]